MLSVVIPTFNRGNSLRITLDSVVAQDVEVPYEIIVVDNNSSDATRDVVRSYGHVRYVFEARRGLCHARNSGIGSANGDVIIFSDDDIIARRDWLRRLHRVYVDKPDAWCVGGKIILNLSLSPPAWFNVQTMSGYLSGLDRGDNTVGLTYPDDVWGANFSVSRLALDRVGLFRTDLDRVGKKLLSGGDTEMCWRIQRAGGGVYYCGPAVVEHQVPASRVTRTYLRRRAYWGGRTEYLLGMKRSSLRPLFLFMAWKLARHALGRPVDPARAFEATLEAWYDFGHMQQSVLCSVPAFGHAKKTSKLRYDNIPTFSQGE